MQGADRWCLSFLQLTDLFCKSMSADTMGTSPLISHQHCPAWTGKASSQSDQIDAGLKWAGGEKSFSCASGSTAITSYICAPLPSYSEDPIRVCLWVWPARGGKGKLIFILQKKEKECILLPSEEIYGHNTFNKYIKNMNQQWKAKQNVLRCRQNDSEDT